MRKAFAQPIGQLLLPPLKEVAGRQDVLQGMHNRLHVWQPAGANPVSFKKRAVVSLSSSGVSLGHYFQKQPQTFGSWIYHSAGAWEGPDSRNPDEVPYGTTDNFRYVYTDNFTNANTINYTAAIKLKASDFTIRTRIDNTYLMPATSWGPSSQRWTDGGRALVGRGVGLRAVFYDAAIGKYTEFDDNRDFQLNTGNTLYTSEPGIFSSTFHRFVSFRLSSLNPDLLKMQNLWVLLPSQYQSLLMMKGRPGDNIAPPILDYDQRKNSECGFANFSCADLVSSRSLGAYYFFDEDIRLPVFSIPNVGEVPVNGTTLDTPNFLGNHLLGTSGRTNHIIRRTRGGAPEGAISFITLPFIDVTGRSPGLIPGNKVTILPGDADEDNSPKGMLSINAAYFGNTRDSFRSPVTLEIDTVKLFVTEVPTAGIENNFVRSAFLNESPAVMQVIGWFSAFSRSPVSSIRFFPS